MLALWVFGLLGLFAIASGGSLMAFTAKRPSRKTAWASAYLVLIVGLMQAGLGAGLYHLAPNAANSLVLVAFGLFNLGNAGVLVGTIYKSRLAILVNAGAVFIAAAVLIMMQLIKNASPSWQLIVFYALIIIILVSMSIGLVLSRRRHGV